MPPEQESHRKNSWRSKANWALAGFLMVAAYFLITEHRAHVIDFLPFILLLACPLLHLFMHRGHGHGANRGHEHSGEGDKRE